MQRNHQEEKMKLVKDILSDKGAAIYSIGPDDSVLAALQVMAEKGVGALAVMEGDALRGMISERDYARKVFLQGRSSPDTRVGEVMSVHVVCATPEQNAEECMALMTDKRVRHLPIVENGQVVGMVSIGDLVKAIISDQKFIIEQLEHYINT
jgi:CBS domain-containing protein